LIETNALPLSQTVAEFKNSDDNNNKNFALARLLLDFGVVNTTDDDCEQQIPSVALCLQQTWVWSDAKSNSRPH